MYLHQLPAARKTLIYRCTVIVLLLVITYGNTLNHGFAWDDVTLIVDNPLLTKLSNIPLFFVSEDRTEGSTGYYRPVTYVSFALDHALWGNNPVGFNITNLLLQIIATLLFFRTVADLFQKESLAFTAALLFALHPLAGESVNFHAGGRNTLLCACFALLSLLLHLHKKYYFAVASFIAAIFAKEFALLMPVIFLTTDYYLLRRKKSWPVYCCYLLSITLYLTLRSSAVQHANFLKTILFPDSLMAAPGIVVKYLWHMIAPFDLRVLYDFNTCPLSWKITCTVLLTGLVTAAILFRKHKEIPFSVGWMFLFMLPILNIIPLGDIVIADRYAYFSLMGFSILPAFILDKMEVRQRIGLLVMVCLSYGGITISRNSHWQNSSSLYRQMTLDAPTISLGFQNLGAEYLIKGNKGEAEKYLLLAYGKKNASFKTLLELMTVYLETDRLDQALNILTKEQAKNQNDLHTAVMISSIYQIMGNDAMAKNTLAAATLHFPGLDEMMIQRATSLCRSGERFSADHRYQEAKAFLVEALLVKPTYLPTLMDLGTLYAETGELQRAVEYFRKAITLEPLNPAPHYNLSVAYDMMGKTKDAKEELANFNELNSHPQEKGAASGQ